MARTCATRSPMTRSAGAHCGVTEWDVRTSQPSIGAVQRFIFQEERTIKVSTYSLAVCSAGYGGTCTNFADTLGVCNVYVGRE